MSPRLVWLAAILLPFLASCSSVISIVKGPDQTNHRCEQKSESPASDPQVGPAEEEGAFHIVGKVADEKDELCPDQGYDDGIKRDIQKTRPIHPLLFPLNIKEPQAQGDAQGQHKTVCMNGQGPDFEYYWKHAQSLLKIKLTISRTAPQEMQESATLKVGQCQFLT